MCETSRHSNPQTEVRQLVARPSHPNERDLQANIERIEGELREKVRALERSLHEQALLRGQLNACVHIIQNASKQLIEVDIDLKNKRQIVRDQIEGLEQEIIALQCSNEAWLNRSLSLQFEILTKQDEILAVKAHNDLAVCKNTQLETELKAVKAENKALKIQIDNNRGSGNGVANK